MSTIQTTNLKHESSGSNNIVLDSSGNIAVQAGTVSAPAIQATGDSNTGIYFPAADNIGFTTGGTIRGRWTTYGLCFNADTAEVNALDDYEEGTWTPVFKGAGTAGTYTISQDSNQTATYTKIGNMVRIQASFGLSAASGGSAYAVIEGMPWNIGDESVGTVSLGSVDLAADTIQVNMMRVSAAQNTRLFFSVTRDNASLDSINVAGFTTSSSIMMSMTYRAA